MSKTDLYTAIHKAQRVHLFALSTKIGRTDFGNEAELEQVKTELQAMIEHLRKHSKIEATFIHPLFEEIGDEGTHLNDEHEELEETLEKLENIIAEGQWNKLYAEFNRLIASYLTHQDEEERAQEEILWKHFDNERLSGVLTAFFASRSPATAKEDLKFLIPGLSLPEIVTMFSRISCQN